MGIPVWRTVFRQPTLHADGAKQPNRQWRQYLVTIVVNIGSIASGAVFGWAAPMLPVLQSEESPLGIPPITDAYGSWLASIYCISRIITLPFYMYAIDRLGCKITGFLVAVPLILSYSMMLFANSQEMLLWARFIMGIAIGGTGILAPSYTIDIAEDSNKGKLGIIFAQSMNIGTLISFVMGFYTSYAVFHACCLIMCVFFALALFWLPESPLFLMTKGKTEQAKEVLKWLRNDKESEFELERMKIRAQEVLEKRKRKVSLSDLTDRRMLRALFICLGITLNQQLTGMAPIESFAVTIFEQAGSPISPNLAAIILGALLIVGTYFSSITVEKYGRRFLFLTSDIVITLCLFAVGAHFHFQSLGWDLEMFGWLPIFSLAMYILSTGMGLGALPFTIATEMVHSNYRSFVQTANVMTLSTFAFLATITFVPIMTVFGQQGCFWLYAVCCAVGTLCIFLFLPETKNRSLEEVLEQLNSNNYVHSVLNYKPENRNMGKSASAAISSTAPESGQV